MTEINELENRKKEIKKSLNPKNSPLKKLIKIDKSQA